VTEVKEEVGIRYVAPRHIVIDGNPSPAGFWKIEPIYLGKTVVVLGGGPSHVEVDLSNLGDNCNIIAVNSSCRKAMEFAKKKDILYFSDNSWSERFREELIESWPGIVVTSNRNTKVRLQSLVNRLDLQNIVEYMQLKSDHVMASSGHTSACLAGYLGAKRIILTGFECQVVNGRTHGHEDYVQENIHAFEERYIPAWNNLAFRFKEFGIEVVNTSFNSAIKDFTFLSFKEAVLDV